MESESFSYPFDINKGLNVDICVEYESFSFDPIITDLLFGSHKSEFVESETIVIENFDLDQTLAHFAIKRFVDSGPIYLPRQFIHNDTISRPMTHLLVKFECISLFDVWPNNLTS